jgi:hypothetical protein
MIFGKRERERPDVPPFLDTPAGIITVSGVRFQTTRKLLEEYAGAVLRVAPLETLIARAEVWLRSGQTVALWLLAPLLLVLPPAGAAGIALTAYLAWETISPLFVSRRAAEVLRVLEMPAVQAVLYVAVLSALGIRGQLGAVGVGLGGFVLVRWQILPLLARPLIALLRRHLFTLPAPDQVLRAFVLRAALRHRISLPHIDRLREEWRR